MMQLLNSEKRERERDRKRDEVNAYRTWRYVGNRKKDLDNCLMYVEFGSASRQIVGVLFRLFRLEEVGIWDNLGCHVRLKRLGKS